MKGMKLSSGPQVRKLPSPQKGNGTPFMAEHLEEALTGGPSTRPHMRDSDMSAFNKLVSSMKASGTLPSHPKTNKNHVSMLRCAGDGLPLYCHHFACYPDEVGYSCDSSDALSHTFLVVFEMLF